MMKTTCGTTTEESGNLVVSVDDRSSNTGNDQSKPTGSTYTKNRSIRCQFCPQKYYSHYSVYISHLNHSHRQEMGIRSDIRIDSRTFNTYEEFSRFKCELEHVTQTHYNKSNSRSDSYILFKCHRFGEPRQASSNLCKPVPRSPKEMLWTKSCPAFMRMIKVEEGKYWTEYCTYHLGHYGHGFSDNNATQQTSLPIDSELQTNNIVIKEEIPDQPQEQMMAGSETGLTVAASSKPKEDPDDQKENQNQQTSAKTNSPTKMVPVQVPVEHQQLFETIVQLIKNQENLQTLCDTVESLRTIDSGSMIRTSMDDNSENGGTVINRRSKRKRS